MSAYLVGSKGCPGAPNPFLTITTSNPYFCNEVKALNTLIVSSTVSQITHPLNKSLICYNAVLTSALSSFNSPIYSSSLTLLLSNPLMPANIN